MNADLHTKHIVNKNNAKFIHKSSQELSIQHESVGSWEYTNN